MARDLVRPGQPALAEITRAFGRSFLDESGRLRRRALAGLVFADPAARGLLEGILQPRITVVWSAQLAAWRTQGVDLAVMVIPLLFETGAEGGFDATVCVACSSATQHSTSKMHLGGADWPDFEETGALYDHGTYEIVSLVLAQRGSRSFSIFLTAAKNTAW